MDARASLFRNWRDSSLRAQGKEVGGTEQVQVRPSGEGRGLGLFASRQFGVGECVLREGPLLRWSSNAGAAVAADADATPAQGTPDIFQLSAKWLEAQLARLPAEDQSAYYGLSCRPDLLDKGQSLAIWVSNALPADEENENGQTDTSAVYRVACRSNHACGANCAHAWSRSRQQLTLHAVRPIAAGEELTINYLGGGNGARARPERQAALGGLGFCCACGVCALPPAEVAESDARRARVAALSELLQQEKGPQGARSYEECAAALEELLKLYALEGIAEAWAHADMASLMAKAWATGNKEACAAWGERWVASMTILVGDGYSVKEKLAVLTHGFRARQAQGDSETAPSDEPSKQAAAEPQPKEEEVD